jgi:D-sedoheptulose 7-phosphate isomerase
MRPAIETLLNRYPTLKAHEPAISEATELLVDAFRNGKKLLVCGNGGSAADALHIVGELMKSFTKHRPLPTDLTNRLIASGERGAFLAKNLQGALPAISLVNEVSLQTAYGNDVAPVLEFAQQVYGYGVEGDVLLGISTSGNSENVICACEVARAKGMKTISLTGLGGGKLRAVSDVLIDVPETETYRVQELHLPIYHAICIALEDELF